MRVSKPIIVYVLGAVSGALAFVVFVTFTSSDKILRVFGLSKVGPRVLLSDAGTQICKEEVIKDNPNKTMFTSCSGFFDE